MRALAFAAAPILFIALGAGIVLRMDRVELFGLRPQPDRPDSVFAINLVVLIYRLVAIVDAYRVAEYLNASRRPAMVGWAGRGSPRNPLSIAGLLAVLLVMAGSHVVVARYDMLALDVLDSDCIFIGDDSEDVRPATPTPSPSPDAAEPAEPGRRSGPSRPTRPTPEPTPTGSARARGLDPAVGRQGTPEHPADRRRPATERRPTTPTR